MYLVGKHNHGQNADLSTLNLHIAPPQTAMSTEKYNWKEL
jgi:hypothetical protein